MKKIFLLCSLFSVVIGLRGEALTFEELQRKRPSHEEYTALNNPVLGAKLNIQLHGRKEDKDFITEWDEKVWKAKSDYWNTDNYRDLRKSVNVAMSHFMVLGRRLSDEERFFEFCVNNVAFAEYSDLSCNHWQDLAATATNPNIRNNAWHRAWDLRKIAEKRENVRQTKEGKHFEAIQKKSDKEILARHDVLTRYGTIKPYETIS